MCFPLKRHWHAVATVICLLIVHCGASSEFVNKTDHNCVNVCVYVGVTLSPNVRVCVLCACLCMVCAQKCVCMRVLHVCLCVRACTCVSAFEVMAVVWMVVVWWHDYGDDDDDDGLGHSIWQLLHIFVHLFSLCMWITKHACHIFSSDYPSFTAIAS